MTMRPLAVTGNVNVDLIMGPVRPWPQAGTEVIASHQELRPGGAATYTAQVWEALGAEHVIAANTGSDLYGRWLIEGFGTRAQYWRREDTATTVSVGLTHPDGERTFFTSVGHLPELNWSDVRLCLEKQRLDGGMLLLCGCFLTDTLALDYPELFDWADERQIDIAIDPGWPPDGWTRTNRELARGWISRCRHVLINEIEAQSLSQESNTACAQRHLLEWTTADSVIVIKAGSQGVLALSPKEGFVRVEAPQVSVIDSIGAGDAFNGGYLFSLACGEPLRNALIKGVDIASRAISTVPRRYLPEPESGSEQTV